MTANQVVVVGAGIVGVSSAIYLRRAGFNVTVIDPLPSPGGASFGNAGIISADTTLPIALPGMLWKVPGWLADPMGPLTVRKRYLLKAMPWLMRWVRAGFMDRVIPISEAIRSLHKDAWDVYRDLLTPDAFSDLLRPGGHVQMWNGDEVSKTGKLEHEIRTRLGVESQRLSRSDLRNMFPGIADKPMTGYMIRGNGHTVSPRRLVRHLCDVARAEGAVFVPERVMKLIPGEAGGWTIMTNAANHLAEKVLVAAGAWSSSLLDPIGVKLPLDTERGYHAMIADPSIALPYTILHKDWGMSLSPMDEGLCASGTVEIAGVAAAPDENRARILAQKARYVFPDLKGRDPILWMGCRPSFPDTLPVIDAAPGHRDLYLFFGHGHYGMTGGPTGARLIAQMMRGSAPSIDMRPYSATRF
ncbi:MAG: FAD-binding oxidoreductase [Alphaproteobacteria bacterium]|mgnify:CR=1 FL=1|nr:FAD-binding oxidoreductase [Alphaproteobacteria bacterium]